MIEIRFILLSLPIYSQTIGIRITTVTMTVTAVSIRSDVASIVPITANAVIRILLADNLKKTNLSKTTIKCPKITFLIGLMMA